MNERYFLLKKWVQKTLKNPHVSITKLAGDASFRVFYRCGLPTETFIAIDSPPNLENNQMLLDKTKIFLALGHNVPNIYAHNLKKGFLLVEDFGNKLLSTQINEKNQEEMYQKAIDNLLLLQKTPIIYARDFKEFDEKEIKIELDRFSDWFLQKELGFSIKEEDRILLNETFNLIIMEIKKQPKVLMHRDYHSRNLMILEKEKIGVLDYQDSLIGPVGYDLVSLLKDCYITLSKEKRTRLVQYYLNKAINEKIIPEVDVHTYLRWFDFTGMQRHIKILGIFARLAHRDEKKEYLKDMPIAYKHIIDVTTRYNELKMFHNWLEQNIGFYFK